MIDYGLFQTENSQMMKLLESIPQIAKTGSSIFIQGEQGVGKSLLVQYITEKMNPSRKLIQWRHLLTGQVLPQAQDVILIDRLEELNSSEQEDVVQLIESFRRTNTPIQWISCSSSPAIDLLKENRIRRDLFFKLSVLQLEIPSLRRRPEDIVVLARFFVQVFSLMRSQSPCVLSEKAIEKLQMHNWIGNIAELENVIERALVLSSGGVIQENEVQFTNYMEGHKEEVGTTLSEMEKKLILQTLQLTQQNKTRAAQILGISIRTLRNKLNEYREMGLA